MPTALNVPFPPLIRGEWTQATFPITAAQTFKPGDWVYLTTAGALSIAAASGNDVGNIKLLGIARGDAAQLLLAGVDCPVDMPQSGAEFLTQLYHSTAASAVLAASDLDAPTTLPLRNQGGRWVVNVENDNTNDRIQIVERHDQYPASEQYGWFWARPLDAGTLTGGI